METILKPATKPDPAVVDTNRVVLSNDFLLTMWQEELSFYNRLLAWWLLNCEPEQTSELEHLALQFNRLQNKDLAAVRENWNVAQSAQYQSLSGSWEAPSLELCASFDAFEQDLCHLKLKIFRGFGPFGHLQIW